MSSIVIIKKSEGISSFQLPDPLLVDLLSDGPSTLNLTQRTLTILCCCLFQQIKYQIFSPFFFWNTVWNTMFITRWVINACQTSAEFATEP